MDETRFRELLASRHLAPDDVERSVAVVRRFESFVGQCRPSASVDRATAGDLHRFVADLAGERAPSFDDILAIARYGLATGNGEVQVAALELIDGIEVPANLARKLGELVGEERRDEAFGDLAEPTIGATPLDRAVYMGLLIERLEARVDHDTLRVALNSGLHYVPPEQFAAERERYLAASDIDSFVADEHRRYVEYLRELQESGTLYFTQPITDAVVEWVEATAECGPGVRVGAEIHATKIPCQADAWLSETDETMKRYRYCHCMWARESIVHPEAAVPTRFCQCSAGFEKMYWDAVLGTPVQVDVIRTVLEGAPVCEFAVHLPTEAIPAGA